MKIATIYSSKTYLVIKNTLVRKVADEVLSVTLYEARK